MAGLLSKAAEALHITDDSERKIRRLVPHRLISSFRKGLCRRS